MPRFKNTLNSVFNPSDVLSRRLRFINLGKLILLAVTSNLPHLTINKICKCNKIFISKSFSFAFTLLLLSSFHFELQQIQYFRICFTIKLLMVVHIFFILFWIHRRVLFYLCHFLILLIKLSICTSVVF